VREYLAEQHIAADEVPREQLAKALSAAADAGRLSAEETSATMAALLEQQSPAPAIIATREIPPHMATEEAPRAPAKEASPVFLFVARRPARADGGSTLLGDLRLRLAQELEHREGGFARSPRPHFVWITEFPLFTRADGDKAHLARGRWSSTHHPFTAPMAEDVELLGSRDAPASDEQLAQIRGQHYDLVLNGQEVGGGSVRIHGADVQEHVMRNVLRVRPSKQRLPRHRLIPLSPAH
jgi:aspartyl-tRNA synthetase